MRKSPIQLVSTENIHLGEASMVGIFAWANGLEISNNLRAGYWRKGLIWSFRCFIDDWAILFSCWIFSPDRCVSVVFQAREYHTYRVRLHSRLSGVVTPYVAVVWYVKLKYLEWFTQSVSVSVCQSKNLQWHIGTGSSLFVLWCAGLSTPEWISFLPTSVRIRTSSKLSRWSCNSPR
jgi:hypothetical protein